MEAILTDARESAAREVLARAYEAATDAPFGAGQRFHAANVRSMDKRDYADWKDRAAIAAMLEFADREREACAKVADAYARGPAAQRVHGLNIAAAIRNTDFTKGDEG